MILDNMLVGLKMVKKRVKELFNGKMEINFKVIMIIIIKMGRVGS